MSWEHAGSPSIMALSLRQSEHTDHMLVLTIFFTELRSTALLTCWQVKPKDQVNLQRFASTLISTNIFIELSSQGKPKFLVKKVSSITYSHHVGTNLMKKGTKKCVSSAYRGQKANKEILHSGC